MNHLIFNINARWWGAVVALAICILTPLPGSAEEYVGMFLVGDSYSQKNVKVELLPAAETGMVVLRLHDVKFSRWMPVTIDLDIPEVVNQDGTLTLERTNTIYKGEPYTKKPATALRGSYDTKQLTFSVYLGDTKVRYESK